MGKYRFCLIVNDEKLNDIFKRMAKAKEEIEKCYEELRALDLIGILPETEKGEINAGSAKDIFSV